MHEDKKNINVNGPSPVVIHPISHMKQSLATTNSPRKMLFNVTLFSYTLTHIHVTVVGDHISQLYIADSIHNSISHVNYNTKVYPKVSGLSR
jgi:hypothetical protein